MRITLSPGPGGRSSADAGVYRSVQRRAEGGGGTSMLRLIGRRLLTLVPTLIIVTFGVFLLAQLLPSDPAVVAAGGESATPQGIAQAREDLHLNDPVLTQYWH